MTIETAPSLSQVEARPEAVRLVGIGASAGGLEALRELMESLPDSSQLCYVIAQHVSPTHVSMLMSLLSPMTSLQVQDLADQQVPEPGVVYITPPNKDVILQEGRLRLTEPRAAIGPKPSINHFFHSLAAELGEQAIGVILSGTGSDGSSGMRAIKAAGGVTIVQEPESAKYDGMPRAAIHTGCIDLILPTARIGPALARLLDFPSDLAPTIDPTNEADAYLQISNLVRSQAAFKLSDYKPATVQRRIVRRMGIVGVSTLEQYIALLKANRDEARQLMHDTFIGVTAFFRDAEAFAALARVIAELVSRREGGEVIRCWVPGCSSGEEVYSIAMLFEQALQEHGKAGLQYMIFASDLDDDAIEHARQAMYPLTELDDVPRPLRLRYMEVIGDHARIAKSVRNRVVFTRQNVIEDPPFSRMDLISCRNLLIYFVPAVQKRVLEVFHYALNTGGCLFLGRSESVEQHGSLFASIDARMRLYRRQAGGAHYALPLAQGMQRLSPGKKEGVPGGHASADLIGTRALERLAERYAPASLVIDAHDVVVHFQGDPKPFLGFPKGRADMYLFDLVDGAVRAELRALVFHCRRVLQPVEGGVRAVEADGHTHLARLAVCPLEADKGELLLVSFVPARAENDRPPAAGVDDEGRDSLVISELEQELARTRAHSNARSN